MAKNPKFSIIVPVYNVEQYLSCCMESLINQTIKDIEIICINDGSTDNSLNILREYEKTDSRIIVVDKINGGLSSARNAGLDIAEGNYILFVDSDDYLEKNACERLYMEIMQENPDVIVFGTKIFPWIVMTEYSKWLNEALRVETKKYEGDCTNALFYERASKPFVWNECYRRELLEKKHIRFDEGLRYGEDMLFLFMIFPRVTKVVYIQDQLYCYRCERDGSLMNKAGHDIEWKLNMHMNIIEKILEDWKENDFIESTKDDLHYWCLEFMIYDLEQLPISKTFRKKMANKLSNIIEQYGLRFSRRDKIYQRMQKRLEKLAV